MAAHGALRLGRMADNLAQIVAIEAICAAQAIEARAPLKTAQKLQQLQAAIRRHVPRLEGDRYLADDLTAAARAVASGELARAAELELELVP